MEHYEAACPPMQNHYPQTVDPNDVTRHFMNDLVGRGNIYRVNLMRDVSTTYLHVLGDPKLQDSTSPSALLPGLIKQLGELNLLPACGMSFYPLDMIRASSIC